MSLRVKLDRDTKDLCESTIELNETLFDHSKEMRELSVRLVKAVDESNIRQSFRKLKSLKDAFDDVEKRGRDEKERAAEERFEPIRSEIETANKLIDQILGEGGEAEEKRKAAILVKLKAQETAKALLWKKKEKTSDDEASNRKIESNKEIQETSTTHEEKNDMSE